MPSPSQSWGLRQEQLAEQWLCQLGYRMVARNWRGGGGEIDRIAWQGAVLCFIEVRARAFRSLELPALTVNRRKQRLLVRAAACYLEQMDTRVYPVHPMARFDIVSILVQPDGQSHMQLFQNAFDAETFYGPTEK